MAAYTVETPLENTDTIVLFVPGISGGAHLGRFQPLVSSLLRAGFAVARVNLWENLADVEQKSFSEIYKDLEEVITQLHTTYPHIYGIGKSFGGAIMLTHPSVYIQKKVLWAPAIGVTKSGGNINTYIPVKLGNVNSLLDIQVDQNVLQNIESPTLILHGTADENIPFSNSEEIAALFPHAHLVPIEGADHSFTNKEHEANLVEQTVSFLRETNE